MTGVLTARTWCDMIRSIEETIVSELGRQLSDHAEEIIDLWYRDWRASPHPHEDVPEDLLRDSLAAQLRLIGEQLSAASPELPREMWKIAERLHPEERIAQQIPIEEEVLTYKIFVSVVREWIETRDIEVSFQEYSFFYEAVFELVAESVMRYASHQAARVREARSRHLASISHQMKTPIATISMATQLLSPGMPDEADVLESMRRAVRRLKILTGGLMRLERFRPEETPVRAERFRVADLIEEIVLYHRPTADASDLELVTEVDPQLEMTADPELCTDAIDNLVQNAVKYTSRGEIRVAADADEHHVTIEVIDQGPGISPQRQKDVFRPVSPGAAGGAGIGLAIARHAVVAQNGEIGLDSEPGQGCRFWIRLPREVPQRG